MSCSHLESSDLKPPSPAQAVYREECTQCFDSIDDVDGLDVCLHCFNGGCAGEWSHRTVHRDLWKHPLALNIKRKTKNADRIEPPKNVSKLAITAETEEDRFDTILVASCLECRTQLDHTSPKLAPIIESILKADTFSRREEVKAWEQELTTCEHIVTLQQQASRRLQQGDLAHCFACNLFENLWLCLECGNLGCGRKQLGGIDGNSHALEHSRATNHGVAVKLGSITPEGTADVYCYRCDEERLDLDLAQHLSHWGIMLAERQKTEKSLTEMQIEQNMKLDFSMTASDGHELKSHFGPGLTGLRNLGNSCYLASIVQCLFDLPSFHARYYRPLDHLLVAQEPANDLETQLRKMADGLLSGRYSKPDQSMNADAAVKHQRGLAPAMLKHLVSRGHEEFSTMRQQDALEFLQHILKLITRSRHSENLTDPTRHFRFLSEQRLQCLNCRKVRYSTTEQDNVLVDVPLETVAPPEGTEGSVPRYKAITLEECLDRFCGIEQVELNCSACNSREGFTKKQLFKTFPDVLVVAIRKMTIVNWVPIKVDVPVLVPDEPFELDQYLSKGPQDSEEVLSDEAEIKTSTFVPDPSALAQLEAMGFPQVRCEKALHVTGNIDATAAMEWLFGHMEDPDIDTPLHLTDQKVENGDESGAADPETISMLVAMGFGASHAAKALKETRGDVERAIEWLFSHPDDQGTNDNNYGCSRGDDSPVPDLPVGSAAIPASFQLQSIVCHKGTSIHAGHYVAFIRKQLEENGERWMLFNDEKVVEAHDVKEMRKSAYIYFFKRI